MTVLLGWEAAEHGGGDDAALRLAVRLARAEQSPVVVATVVPPDPTGPSASRRDRETLQWRAALTATRQAEALTALRAAGVDDVRTAVVPAASVPAGLVEAASTYRARLLVLGAAAEAPAGRFAAGSVAGRLLRSSPVPLALAPRAWAADAAPARLTCAWAGAERSADALAATRRFADRWGVPVRLVTFAPGPADDDAPAGSAQRALDEAVAGWSGPAPEALLARGAGWAGAVAAVPWVPGDVLVVGSARLGTPGQVSVGSAGTGVLRAATVPLLVVPRGTPSTS